MASPVNDSYAGDSASIIAGGRVAVSSFWRNLSAGWTNITPTGTRPYYGILAFSGSAWDAKGGKLYINGGGHADYGGNEVWEWDYENRASAFVKHYEPDFTDIFSGPYTPAEKYALLAPYVDNVNYPGAVMVGGQPVRPICRHTYGSVVWLPHLNKLTVGGGSTFSGQTPVDYWANVWPNSPGDFWYYDPLAKAFEYRGSKLLNSAYTTNVRVKYHPSRLNLFGVAANISNRAVIYEYDTAANTWAIHANAGPSLNITGALAVVDTLRDRLIVLMKPSASAVVVVYSYDLTTHQWAEITTTGTAPTHLNSEAAAVYSTQSDAVWLMRAYTDGLVKLSLETGEWITESVVGPTNVQTFGNWFYDSRRNVGLFIHQHGSDIRVWAYKE